MSGAVMNSPFLSRSIPDEASEEIYVGSGQRFLQDEVCVHAKSTDSLQWEPELAARSRGETWQL